MKQMYTLRGLSCANCAARIEADVKTLRGVTAVSCSAIHASLTFEAAEPAADLLSVIEKIVHKYEPDVSVHIKTQADKEARQKEARQKEAEDQEGRQRMFLIGGAALFVLALCLRGWPYQNLVFLAGYLVLGWKVLYNAVRNLRRGRFLDENFLMGIASVGALAVGEFAEAVAVMLFYGVGEYFQERAVRKSRKSIADLMDIRPDFAHIREGGVLRRVSPEDVNVGDVIVVKPGEKIPLDGVVLEGESFLDTRALTGESVPRSAKPNDTVLSGCINVNGVLAITTTKTFGESTVAKILDLVENASSKKSTTENFITTFARYYTPLVVGLAVLIAVLPPLFFGGAWADWIHRALVMLVISCPCALVISIPLGFFGGIGAASKNGVLVKGSHYLEALNHLDIVVFDKTGTLTKGAFEVTRLYPAEGFTEDRLLAYAAMAESFSNHPLARSITKAYGREVDKTQVAHYQEIPGQGVRVTAEGLPVLAGNGVLLKEAGIAFTESDEPGTKVYVAVDGRFAGYMVIADEIKPDSHKMVARLKAQGIRKTVMLTGDDRQIAEAVARTLSIDEVHAQLLPDQKVALLEALDKQKQAQRKLAFVGDGINDAPVLARADIGIAMGGLGSDAAIEAADIVLMTDEPSKLADAVTIAQATKRIVTQNIVLALGIKGICLLLGALGLAGMWEAVFADVGVSVLAIVNALRVMRIKI